MSTKYNMQHIHSQAVQILQLDLLFDAKRSPSTILNENNSTVKNERSDQMMIEEEKSNQSPHLMSLFNLNQTDTKSADLRA